MFNLSRRRGLLAESSVKRPFSIVKGRLLMQASSASFIQDPSEHVHLPAVEPVALRQTELDDDEPTVLEVLTDFPEATFERGDLPRVVVGANHDLPQPQAVQDAVEERPEFPPPPPEWCVDQGGSIVAMSTFELWMALARGDVDGQTRVWGLGMDNWEIVADIPDLKHALTDSLSLVPPRVIRTPTAMMSVRGHDRTPLGFGTTDAANDDFPAQSGPLLLRRQGFSFGRVTVAAGVLAVAAAIGLTIVPRTSDMTDQAAGAQRPLAMARLQGAMERANRQVDEAAHRWVEAEAARAVEPVAPSARKHKDVGQRRSRRGRH
jgi:hypothetical protein